MTVVRLPRPPYPDLLGQEEKDRLEAQLEGERARELDRLAQRLYGTCAHSQSTFSAIDYFFFFTYYRRLILLCSLPTRAGMNRS